MAYFILNIINQVLAMWNLYLGHYSLMDHRASKGWHWCCYYFASGAGFEFALQTKPMTTNNQAEYEAILKGLQLVQEVKTESIEIFGDSQLVINQLIGLYECKDDILKGYLDEC